MARKIDQNTIYIPIDSVLAIVQYFVYQPLALRRALTLRGILRINLSITP
jgi:hypothetical protein